jgi:hypothetical protein|tara:strand:+ start:800 stop:1171 length:372 start_codon:yes stop_codon:yes gene_type:complete
MTTKQVPIQIWNELKKIRNKKDRLTGKRRTRKEIQQILLTKYGYKVSLKTIERWLPLKIDEQLDIQIDNQTLDKLNNSIKQIDESLLVIAYQLYTFNCNFLKNESSMRGFFNNYFNLLNKFDE